MAQINQHKVVVSLPDPLEANSIYYVRAGTGFDIYITNSSGVIVAYEQNVYLPEAAEVKVVDAGNYFVSNDVEGALQELGSDVENIEASLDGKVDAVADKQLSDQNYTLDEKNKLSTLENYDDTDVLLSLSNKVDKVSGKQLSDENYTLAEKDKLASLDTSGLVTVGNSTGEIPGAKIWIGQTNADSNGSWTIDYSSAGFTAVFGVFPSGIAKGDAPADRLIAVNGSAAPTNTTARGNLMSANLTGILAVTLAASSGVVRVLVIGR